MPTPVSGKVAFQDFLPKRQAVDLFTHLKNFVVEDKTKCPFLLDHYVARAAARVLVGILGALGTVTLVPALLAKFVFTVEEDTPYAEAVQKAVESRVFLNNKENKVDRGVQLAKDTVRDAVKRLVADAAEKLKEIKEPKELFSSAKEFVRSIKKSPECKASGAGGLSQDVERPLYTEVVKILALRLAKQDNTTLEGRSDIKAFLVQNPGVLQSLGLADVGDLEGFMSKLISKEFEEESIEKTLSDLDKPEMQRKERKEVKKLIKRDQERLEKLEKKWDKNEKKYLPMVNEREKKREVLYKSMQALGRLTTGKPPSYNDATEMEIAAAKAVATTRVSGTKEKQKATRDCIDAVDKVLKDLGKFDDKNEKLSSARGTLAKEMGQIAQRDRFKEMQDHRKYVKSLLEDALNPSTWPARKKPEEASAADKPRTHHLVFDQLDDIKAFTTTIAQALQQNDRKGGASSSSRASPVNKEGGTSDDEGVRNLDEDVQKQLSESGLARNIRRTRHEVFQGVDELGEDNMRLKEQIKKERKDFGDTLAAKDDHINGLNEHISELKGELNKTLSGRASVQPSVASLSPAPGFFDVSMTQFPIDQQPQRRGASTQVQGSNPFWDVSTLSPRQQSSGASQPQPHVFNVSGPAPSGTGLGSPQNLITITGGGVPPDSV
jgi:hypothetical protein